MTITTNLRPQGERGFSRPAATANSETVLTLAAGAVLGIYGLARRSWMGVALAGGGGYLLYRGVSDLRRPYQGNVRVAFTIGKTPQEVYDFVRDGQNWKRFLHAVQFEESSGQHIAMKLGESAGIRIQSEAQITDQKPGEYIAWASAGQAIEHRGVIRFLKAPGTRGTEVSVALEYRAPAGPIARSLAAALGWNPEQLVRESLRHLKQLMEAGEIPTTAGQPVGARGVKGAAMRVLYREGPSEDATERVRIAGD